MTNKSLVSVSIITYNSAKYIAELLDSVYNQTYQNIEVVISDDCSKDNTVEVCRKWIAEHPNRFSRFELLEAEVNQGVCANANRAIGACRGEWVKNIAGDDVLPPNSIQEYVNFVIVHSDCEICLAKMKPFGVDEKANEYCERCLDAMFKKFSKPTKELQYREALKNHILPGPGLFFNREFFHRIGEFNPRYRNTEEYDFEIRVFRQVYVPLIDKYLVNWRIRKDSLCNSEGFKTLEYDKRFFSEVQKPLLIKEGLLLYAIDIALDIKSKELFIKGFKWPRIVFYLSPLRYYWGIRDRLRLPK